jgi:hypothetical protein
MLERFLSGVGVEQLVPKNVSWMLILVCGQKGLIN